MKGEEILTCLILVAIGYFIAKMFSRTCNGFRVGGTGTLCPIFPGKYFCNDAPDCIWNDDLNKCNYKITDEYCSQFSSTGFGDDNSTCKQNGCDATPVPYYECYAPQP